MPVFDDSYLNKTTNKWPRDPGERIEFVVDHETASPNADDPHGTLNYNLAASVQSSYNYLIARDGTIFHYIDEKKYIAYHAGVASHARGYAGWYVNVHSIGVEIDGPNDGTPITQAQTDALVALKLYFLDEYGIPLDRSYHLGHKEVAPGYKSDPKCCSLDLVIQLTQEADAARKVEQQDVPDGCYPVDSAFYQSWQLSGGVWRPGTLTPGYAIEAPFLYQEQLYQRFERGIARRNKETNQTEWLLDVNGEKDALLTGRALPVQPHA